MYIYISTYMLLFQYTYTVYMYICIYPSIILVYSIIMLSLPYCKYIYPELGTPHQKMNECIDDVSSCPHS